MQYKFNNQKFNFNFKIVFVPEQRSRELFSVIINNNI